MSAKKEQDPQFHEYAHPLSFQYGDNQTRTMLLKYKKAKRGQIYFRLSVVQLKARLGQSRKVICTLLSHILKARGAVNAVDAAAREAAEQGAIGVAEFDP